MTTHPDHQRRVEEILREMSNARYEARPGRPMECWNDDKHWLRPFAERLARAEANAERLAVAEGAATNDCIQAQSDVQSWRQAAEHWMHEAQRLDAERYRPTVPAPQPLDEGLRERALIAVEMLLRHSYDLGDDRRNSISAVLRDLRTPPASPACTICDDPSHDADHHWGDPQDTMRDIKPAPPTLTDRERIERLGRALISVVRHIQCCEKSGIKTAAPELWTGDVGAIARELASRKEESK